ncbi:MAG: Na+/H+ antiporter subunit E [Defluviitaleaceae bacterium]|nr:Na+/H+ antiporter subunit E [Defluviitaleaceae bacterium]
MSNKNSIYGIILLTVIWIILRESIDYLTVIIGVIVSICCIYFCRKLIPLPKTPKIKFLRFMIYLLFLFGQVYTAGFFAIKVILTDAHIEIVEIRTKMSSMFFKTILVNSITLVPGSVSLGLQGDKITVLWLQQKTKDACGESIEKADEILIGKLQRMLIKAER